MNKGQKRFTVEDVAEALKQVVEMSRGRVPEASLVYVQVACERVAASMRDSAKIQATLERTCPRDGTDLYDLENGELYCPACDGQWESGRAVSWEREYWQLQRMALMESSTLDDMRDDMNNDAG